MICGCLLPLWFYFASTSVRKLSTEIWYWLIQRSLTIAPQKLALKLADMMINNQAARLMVWDAARTAETLSPSFSSWYLIPNWMY